MARSSRRPLLLAAVALAAVGLLSLSAGGADPRLFHFPRGLLETSTAQRELAELVVFRIRAPRVLVAALAGAALSAAGAALQGLFRNPLADPSLLGVSACAAFACQLALYTGFHLQLPWILPVAATTGAGLGAAALIQLIGRRPGSSLEVLLLGGLALAQLAAAASALLLSLSIRDYTRASRMLHWMLGSLDARTWLHVSFGLLPVISGLYLLQRSAHDLDCLSLGELTARSLGVPVEAVRLRLVVATALLAGAAVAMGGVVGFVGLLVPHAVRPFSGGRFALLLPLSGLAGAALLIACDLTSRVVIAPTELQLGVVTAALGAPWFLIVLLGRFRRGLA